MARRRREKKDDKLSAKRERLSKQFDLGDSVGTVEKFDFEDTKSSWESEKGAVSRKKSKERQKKNSRFVSGEKEIVEARPEEKSEQNNPREVKTDNPEPVFSDHRVQSIGNSTGRVSGRNRKPEIGQLDQNSGFTPDKGFEKDSGFINEIGHNEKPSFEDSSKTILGSEKDLSREKARAKFSQRKAKKAVVNRFQKEKNETDVERTNTTKPSRISIKKARQRKEASKIFERDGIDGRKNTESPNSSNNPEHRSVPEGDFRENGPEFKADDNTFGYSGVEKSDDISFKTRQKINRYRRQSEKYNRNQGIDADSKTRQKIERYRKQSEKYHRKAEKAEKKLPKEVELKFVKGENGEGKLILDAHIKDEKDIKKLKKRSMVKKANREIFEKTWNYGKEEKEEKTEYNSDEASEDVFDLGKESAERVFDVHDMVRGAKSAYQQKKYDEFNRFQDKAFKADANIKYETNKLFQTDPEVNKAEKEKLLKKELQKRRIKKNYAKEFRNSAKKAENAAKAGEAAAEGIKGIGSFIEGVKAAIEGGSLAPLFIGIAVVLFILFIGFAVAGGCTVTGGGVVALATSTYLSNMDDIDAAEVYYTKLETDLQESLDEDAYKITHPEFDSIDFVINGEISHNPYTLISYLSAKHGVFTYDTDLENEIKELFNENYTVTESASGMMFQVIVDVKSLEDIVMEKMDDTSKGLYYIYSLTHGLVQVFSTPCDYYWGMLISKNYGYQQNAETGVIEYHNGVTISVPPDTEVKAGLDGVIQETGESEEYGKYLVIYDGEHYTAKYGILENITVGVGDEVKAGDVIAISAEDDKSISGSSLYFECMYDATYYNPCFLFAGYFGADDLIDSLGIPTETADEADSTEDEFLGSLPENGDSGIYHDDSADNDEEDTEEANDEATEEVSEVDDEGNKDTEEARALLFPEDTTDSTGNSVIDEGIKWLGKPYLFSGSNPATGIDCSGFVKWCFEKSGVRPGLPHSAAGIYEKCSPVSASELKVGDLVFFQGTYKSGISHVGIYCGNGEMLHAGDPIQVTSLTKQYYQKHFFGYGRL